MVPLDPAVESGADLTIYTFLGEQFCFCISRLHAIAPCILVLFQGSHFWRVHGSCLDSSLWCQIPLIYRIVSKTILSSHFSGKYGQEHPAGMGSRVGTKATVEDQLTAGMMGVLLGDKG